MDVKRKMNEDNSENRPIFPKRAVITAGMPYGNKELHFGHIGGVFIHADVFARFLRDRIGKENVIFVSGTDCYGSPILESYRKRKQEQSFSGTIEDYVNENHLKQKEALDQYKISLNLFGASGLGRPGEVHTKVSEKIFNLLYDKGYLKKLSSPQFFDPEFKVLLNGRQVVGQCPIQGCSSDKGYADECSLGHQYMPSELINPRSTLSGKTPEVVNVTNWYFRLEDFKERLEKRVDYLRSSTNSRKYMLSAMEEFLKKPVVYIKKNQMELLEEVKDKLPKFEYLDDDNKSSITLVFDDLVSRDMARKLLSEKKIYFRAGKTLVPFRLTGNIEWGVKAPEKEELKDLTFWVWPESLWAPISFTIAYLEKLGKKEEEWKKWWCSSESNVYQFIGEDNIYFYGIAEIAMFMALQEQDSKKIPNDNGLVLPHLIANNHVLFMGRKASSSGKIKLPMAKDLLQHYTEEQLRMHFLSFGLDTKSVSFQPKVYQSKPEVQNSQNDSENMSSNRLNNIKLEGQDPVLKEGNLLTNVFNRMIRSCFYTLQKYYNSKLPKGDITDQIRKTANETILAFEWHMYDHEFHRLNDVMDTYIRSMNKYWVNNIRIAEANNDDTLRKQVLLDTFHAVRTITTLLHPIAPDGCEMVQEYLELGDELWDWDNIFKSLDELFQLHDASNDKSVQEKDNSSVVRTKELGHQLKFLESRVDFFKKHESQLDG